MTSYARGMFGISKSALHRPLHDLKVAGTVKLIVTAKGTAVTLGTH